LKDTFNHGPDGGMVFNDKNFLGIHNFEGSVA
jgi:hypothetical protein